MANFYELQCKYLPQCVYCGEPATTKDHVPPKRLSPFNTITVPACRRCNCELLGDKGLPTVEERRDYVQAELGRRRAAQEQSRPRVAARRDRRS